jgi:hypothetical protein
VTIIKANATVNPDEHRMRIDEGVGKGSSGTSARGGYNRSIRGCSLVPDRSRPDSDVNDEMLSRWK